MSARKGRGGKGRGNKTKRQDAAPSAPSVPSAPSRYAELFMGYRDELDARHDKHERLVKLSRDCTIHSKRTIFTLHQFSGGQEGREKSLSDAETQLQSDVLPVLRSIAMEIEGEDPHRHHRAYSPGVQEFIEALAYYEYLKSGRLISLGEAQKLLSFQMPAAADNLPPEDEEAEKCDPQKDISEELVTDRPAESNFKSAKMTTLQLNPADFLLGLSDLTGELMRLCISSVGSGNRDLPFSLLPFFRALFQGFHSFSSGVKHMGQKMVVLRSSLGKVENVCYTLKVRGSEIPKHMLMDVINATESGVQQED